MKTDCKVKQKPEYSHMFLIQHITIGIHYWWNIHSCAVFSPCRATTCCLLIFYFLIFCIHGFCLTRRHTRYCVTNTRFSIHTLKHKLHTYSAKTDLLDKNFQDNEIETHSWRNPIPVESSNYKYNMHCFEGEKLKRVSNACGKK